MGQELGAGESHWLGLGGQRAWGWVEAVRGGRSVDDEDGVCECGPAAEGTGEEEAAESQENGCYGPPLRELRG